MAIILTFSLVALITATEGHQIDLDKGLIDGLRSGDRGRAYYTLRVDGDSKTIEAGTVELTEVGDLAARGMSLGENVPKPGFLISFSDLEARLTPAELFRLASGRLKGGQFEVSRLYFQKLEALFPDDPLVLRRLREIDRRNSTVEDSSQKAQNIEYYLAAARSFEREGDLPAALQYCERALQLDPQEEEANRLLEALLRRQRREGMFRVKPAAETVGLPIEEARFYNEQPRFQPELEDFWIDSSPVKKVDVDRAEGKPAVADPSQGLAVGVTFQEAARYCLSEGKRLPTEFEWEIAATREDFSPGPFAEWTSSWYQPYPGNRQPEPEYGTRFRVIRGYDMDHRFDRHFRSFMTESQRDSGVAFRCAETERP